MGQGGTIPSCSPGARNGAPSSCSELPVRERQMAMKRVKIFNELKEALEQVRDFELGKRL